MTTEEFNRSDSKRKEGVEKTLKTEIIGVENLYKGETENPDVREK